MVEDPRQAKLNYINTKLDNDLSQHEKEVVNSNEATYMDYPVTDF